MSAMRAVLFDLDGTLVDSAPDLAGTANDMRVARGLEPVPVARLRAMVGAGARGMIGTAFGVAPGQPEYESLRDEFLAGYAARLTRETRVFAAIPAVLDSLHAHGVAWGIVTNKAARFAEPLVAALGLDRLAAAVVSGDTTPHAKPHPAPLLEASRRMAIEPAACFYVGDDLRDVQAGRAAGMVTVAVRWGYLGAGDPIEAWGADHIVDEPAELLTLLRLA